MHQGVQTANEFRSTLFQSRKYVFDVFRACRKQMLSDHLRQFLQEKPRNTLSTPPILALLESLHLSYSSMREISSSCSSQITVSKPRRMYLYSWIKIFTITISVRVVLFGGTSRQAFLLFSSFKKLVKQQEQKMTCSEVKMAKPKRKDVEAQNNITYCTDLIEH